MDEKKTQTVEMVEMDAEGQEMDRPRLMGMRML